MERKCLRVLARSGRDRYTGPFNTVTANPLLVINIRYDPPTPYASAVRASKILPGSRLLTVNGWGHVMALTGSTCANRYVATYLLTGVLPPRRLLTPR